MSARTYRLVAVLLPNPGERVIGAHYIQSHESWATEEDAVFRLNDGYGEMFSQACTIDTKQADLKGVFVDDVAVWSDWEIDGAKRLGVTVWTQCPLEEVTTEATLTLAKRIDVVAKNHDHEWRWATCCPLPEGSTEDLIDIRTIGKEVWTVVEADQYLEGEE